ncbi:uncharacterized protein LOC110046740 isoform X2 [Orbicella faveolata]|uniref:uncharacterized protein LOC110046740 isoform X2 n=1 Tax=Orbicella faveolata TaxID=48498 RepID=UPI0009E58C09|nr:uncharacterized protein LOC110046740 isoform X2 [Orbicella faveolata]
MSGLGRYPLNIPSLSEAFSNFQHGMSNSNQRRDRLDYDDRRFNRDRDRDSRRDDDFRRDSGGSRGRSSRDRFSPEPSYSSYLDDQRRGSQSNLVSYPLGHLNNSRSNDRGNSRNDRNRNQSRDRYRNNDNRSQGNRGPSNQGPGILGAKPGDRSVPELPSNPLQGLGVSGTGGLGSGLTAQLAQQQQQLMAMVQTQSLLAAMQAQANANAQAQVQAQARAKQVMPSPLGGLLPTPLIPRTGGRDMQRQNRKRRNDGWGGGGNYGNKRERFDRNRGQQGNNRFGQNQQNRGRQGGGGAQSQQAKKAVTPDVKETTKDEDAEEEIQEEEEADKEDEDTEEPDASQEDDKQDQEHVEIAPPEENSQPDLPKSVNFIGEDVDSLMISLFDRKRSKYICQECKIICNLPISFHKHLFGKRHARTVLENQGKEFDPNEFKNFTQGSTPAEKSEPEDAGTGAESDEREKASDADVFSPATVQSPDVETNLDFVKYTCDTRKTAMKDGNIITISSVTQARVRIDGFTSGRNMLGCEFVKAVSGFNCRLCKTFIRCGNDVISHIKGKKHQKNYQTYVQEHPQYEEHQLARNKELEVVLEPKEGEEVVLYEVLDKDIKASASKQKIHRKDSQTDEPTEVQITKFVVAPEGTDEAAQMTCEAADLDVSMENMEHLNDDSLVTESGDEQRDTTMTPEEEEELLSDHAEQAGIGEYSGNDVSLSIMAPQLDETEDFIPLTVNEPVKSEEPEAPEEPKIPLSITPQLGTSEDNEKEELQESETPSSSQEEIEATPPKENTPTSGGRRGRKNQTRGGAGRGGVARGRGRGRGSRRSARSAAGPGKAKVKKEKAEEDANNDDLNLMEGFEVIDEIGDGED